MSLFSVHNPRLWFVVFVLFLAVYFIHWSNSSNPVMVDGKLQQPAVVDIGVEHKKISEPVQLNSASTVTKKTAPILNASELMDDDIKIPIEGEELVRWRLDRGYPDESNSYDSYDEATLNALASTGDIRAIHKLAEYYASRGNLSDADREVIASLQRAAALYGSTFAFLNLGVQQESAYANLAADDPQRHSAALEILATYQVAALRGDRMPNMVRGNHFVSRNNIQLTDEDNQLIAARAQEIYNNLSKHRNALALDEFDNNVPESVNHYFGEVETIQQKLKTRANKQ